VRGGANKNRTTEEEKGMESDSGKIKHTKKIREKKNTPRREEMAKEGAGRGKKSLPISEVTREEKGKGVPTPKISMNGRV